MEPEDASGILEVGSGESPCSSILFADPVTPPEVLSGAGIVVQSIPTCAILLAWMFLEMRPRRATPRAALFLASGVALAGVGAQSLLVWRTLSLLVCEERVASDWTAIGVLGSVLASFVSLFLLSPKFPRLAILLFLVAGGGTVVLDKVLRDRAWVAGQQLVSLQQILLLLGVTCFYNLPATPARSAAPRSAARTAPARLPVIDALVSSRHSAFS
jgi:hypothetical protein